jgi:hypothetical protein
LIGRFATAGSESFITLGSVGGISSTEFSLNLSGTQGANSGARSTTAMDISFDDLSVQADTIIGVPEPSTYALFGFAFAGLLAVRARKRLQR